MNRQELLPSKHEVSKGFVNSDPRGDKRKLLLAISGTSWEWWDTLIISAFRRLRNNITSKRLPQNKQQQFPGVNYYHHPFYRKEKQGTGRSGNCFHAAHKSGCSLLSAPKLYCLPLGLPNRLFLMKTSSLGPWHPAEIIPFTYCS